MNFIHAADFHLGYMQYGLLERFRDYARAFQYVIHYAIEHKAEFILISGDLFDKRNINAPTYEQAYKVLSELRSKSPSTQVFAIEGNHDLAFHQDGKGWLEILNLQGLLRLIRLGEKNNRLKDFVELDNIRIFGVRYLGSNTNSIIPEIADEIKKINDSKGKKYTILMMHFGMEGQMKYDVGGEIPYNSLLPLKDLVNYLALGHYHSQNEFDSWVFNPGSFEMISISEYDRPKGFYHVRDSGVKFIDSIMFTRPVRRIDIDISSISTPAELYSKVQHELDRQRSIQSDKQPLIELLLYGTMNFPKSEISLDRIKSMISKKFKPLWCDVKILNSSSQYTLNEGDVRGLTREQIELRVFSDRVKLDGRYRDYVEEIVKTMIEVKKMAAAGIEESAIQKELRWCFEKIKSESKTFGKNPGQKTLTTLLSRMEDA